MNLETYLETWRPRVDATLDASLGPGGGPAETLHAALRYAVLGPGKRLRPILALAACEAFGGRAEDVLAPAAALELIHAYSLIHDDLPAMDDDDLRRGRPTVHRVHGEATAILAGDAAQALAFEILAREPADAPAERRLAAVETVARDAGRAGMVGGQMADLEAEGAGADLERLTWIHRHKTGRLFSASAEVGAIHAGADAAGRAAMRAYGDALGLAFQIADDLLDRRASAEVLGKTPGKDEAAAKSTYPALLGEEASARAADREVERGLTALADVGLDGSPLAALLRYAVARRS